MAIFKVFQDLNFKKSNSSTSNTLSTGVNPVHTIVSLRFTGCGGDLEIWRRRTELAAVMGLRRRGSEDGRKANKRKLSCSKNKLMNLLRCLAFLLFILPGVSSLTVEGLKGGSITLPCNSSNTQKLPTLLMFGSITAYGSNQDEHFKGRVKDRGSCDIILHDLKTTDAGKYTSKVYDNSQLPDIYTYDVRVNVSLTGQKGEELMFVELPHEAENVTHLTNPNWTEVWRRGQGVLTHRLTDNNGNLTMKHFSSSDAGTYRVLNSSGDVLVTVTVTESGSESKDKLDSKHEDKLHDTVRVHDGVWIGIGVMVLVALVVFAIKKIRQHLNKKRGSYQGVPMNQTVQGPRSPNNSNDGEPKSYCHLNTALPVLQLYSDEAADHRAHLHLSPLSITSLTAAVRLNLIMDEKGASRLSLPECTERMSTSQS